MRQRLSWKFAVFSFQKLDVSKKASFSIKMTRNNRAPGFPFLFVCLSYVSESVIASSCSLLCLLPFPSFAEAAGESRQHRSAVSQRAGSKEIRWASHGQKEKESRDEETEKRPVAEEGRTAVSSAERSP